jgi:hypothetical protein
MHDCTTNIIIHVQHHAIIILLTLASIKIAATRCNLVEKAFSIVTHGESPSIAIAAAALLLPNLTRKEQKELLTSFPENGCDADRNSTQVEKLLVFHMHYFL